MIFKQHNIQKINEKVKAFFQGPSWKKTLTFLFFLLISFGFWFLQSLQQIFETEVSIPLRFENIPSDISIVDDIPSEITVKIKGKGTLLSKYTLASYKNEPLKINLGEIDPTKSVHTISKRDLESKMAGYFSPAITLISSTPDILNINYQPLEKKELPIVLSGQLTPATGYLLIDTMLFIPAKVFARGSGSHLDSLFAIYTENISITNIRKPIRKRVNLVVPKGINLDKTSVELNVSAEEYTEKVVLIPIIFKNLPANYKIHLFPSSVEVICQVSLANYGKINDSDFVVSIDYFELIKSPNHTIPVNLTKKPNRIKTYRINPEKVEFLIEEKK